MTIDGIKREALRLSPSVRADLARELLESLDDLPEQDIERLRATYDESADAVYIHPGQGRRTRPSVEDLPLRPAGGGRNDQSGLRCPRAVDRNRSAWRERQAAAELAGGGSTVAGPSR